MLNLKDKINSKKIDKYIIALLCTINKNIWKSNIVQIKFLGST